MRVTSIRHMTAIMQGVCVQPDYTINNSLELKITAQQAIIASNQAILSVRVSKRNYANNLCKTCSGFARRSRDHWRTAFAQINDVAVNDQRYFEGEYVQAVIVVLDNAISMLNGKINAAQNKINSFNTQIDSNNQLITDQEFQRTACEQQNLQDMQTIQQQLLIEEELRQQGVTVTGQPIVPETVTKKDNKIYIIGGLLIAGGIVFVNRKKLFK